MVDQSTRWLTLQDLARSTGFSVSFLRKEIKTGALKATLVKSPSRPRQRGRWRIADVDAETFRGALGFVSTLAAPAGALA